MIHVHGSLFFIGNDGTKSDTAALDVSGFGQVRMFRDAEVNFTDNTGM